MARAVPKNKIGLVSKWAAKPRDNSTGSEARRRQNEAWRGLVDFIAQHGGAVVTPPGKVLRVEVVKDSTLPAKLSELGFRVYSVGMNTRITGAGFMPVDVIEITLGG